MLHLVHMMILVSCLHCPHLNDSSLPCFPVPVYDGCAHNGRPAFVFMDADFKALSSWHLYKKGASEIPLNSVVSVGYMLSTYKGNSGSVLSSNIQFVIVISMPT